MVRIIEVALGLATVFAAILAITFTLFAPIATTGISVDGGAPVVHHLYAFDAGLFPMLAVIAVIALLAVGVLMGAYFHAFRGSAFAHMIVWVAALAYLALVPTSLHQGAFAIYPAVVALACALVTLIPTQRRQTAGAQLHRG